MALLTKVSTQVLPGGRITVSNAAWQEGADAEVLVTILSDVGGKRSSVIDVLSQARGGQAFGSVEDVDAYLTAERSAWDR